MTAPIAELLAPIKEALPRVGEPESTWCMVQGSALRTLIAAVEALAAENQHLRAKVDALMLEHCPEEMTPEQLTEWAKHQVEAPSQEPA